MPFPPSIAAGYRPFLGDRSVTRDDEEWRTVAAWFARREGKGASPRVAVVGGGFGGVTAAVKLVRAGLRDFTVFESSAGPGGVWWDNRYPGAAVDSPTHVYSFSFKRYDWSRSHAEGAELQRYIEETIDDFGLRGHFRFSTRVSKIVWDEAGQRYAVHTDHGVERFDFVISAVGILNLPKHPEWPGLDEFRGPVFHTARWEPEHDLTGKRVAVVGTGSSAAQLVPSIAGVAGKVTVYQREPGWIDPKPVTVYSPEERAALSSPWRYRLERLRAFWFLTTSWKGGDVYRPGKPANEKARQQAMAFLDQSLSDRPDLRKLVTPDYPYHGKRPVKDSNFYQALKREDVELVPRAVRRVTATGVVDTDGVERPADVLVLATGFQPSRYLARLDVRGRGGRGIHDVWAGEPAAFLGSQVPGFPNFFMLYGPNTNTPVVLFFLERQADMAIRLIRRCGSRGATAVEVRESVHDRYNRWVQRQLRGSVWETANNYYKSPGGRVVTQWPAGPVEYWLLSRFLSPFASRFRSAGSAGS
jgi:cation diffusion facilitator CzcD-associated flavoprotein CzcO